MQIHEPVGDLSHLKPAQLGPDHQCTALWRTFKIKLKHTRPLVPPTPRFCSVLIYAIKAMTPQQHIMTHGVLYAMGTITPTTHR